MLDDKLGILLSINKLNSHTLVFEMLLGSLCRFVRDSARGNNHPEIRCFSFNTTNQLLNHIPTNGRIGLPMFGLNRDPLLKRTSNSKCGNKIGPFVFTSRDNTNLLSP